MVGTGAAVDRGGWEVGSPGPQSHARSQYDTKYKTRYWHKVHATHNAGYKQCRTQGSRTQVQRWNTAWDQAWVYLGTQTAFLNIWEGATQLLERYANPHPSPTPACTQLQPLTLRMGPNWPKYAPFTFPKGLETFFGRNCFSQFWAQNWLIWGHAHLRPKQPKTSPTRA